MAQYRNGLKTQSYITAPVDENFKYQFWVMKGRGRFPKFDEETKESHIESLFALDYDETRLKSIHNKDHLSGGNVYGPNTFSYYYVSSQVEEDFLRRVKAVLEAANVPCSFIARGSCSRRGKQAWGFKTVNYFIKAEKNAVLLKLMGIEQMIEEVWQAMESKVDAFYDDYIKEKQRVDAINSAIYTANTLRVNSLRAIEIAQNNREAALMQIKRSDDEESQAKLNLEKAEEELARLKSAL